MQNGSKNEERAKMVEAPGQYFQRSLTILFLISYSRLMVLFTHRAW
jgi:hypothetical protein